MSKEEVDAALLNELRAEATEEEEEEEEEDKEEEDEEREKGSGSRGGSPALSSSPGAWASDGDGGVAGASACSGAGESRNPGRRGGGSVRAESTGSGETEEDSGGYLWRKYGEKTVGIKKRAIKRSYYRCVCFKRHIPCEAKKRVDRLASAQPNLRPLSVTYINKHNHAPKPKLSQQQQQQQDVNRGASQASDGDPYSPGSFHGGSPGPLNTRAYFERMRAEDLAMEMYSDLQLQFEEMQKAGNADYLRRIEGFGADMTEVEGEVFEMDEGSSRRGPSQDAANNPPNGTLKNGELFGIDPALLGDDLPRGRTVGDNGQLDEHPSSHGEGLNEEFAHESCQNGAGEERHWAGHIQPSSFEHKVPTGTRSLMVQLGSSESRFAAIEGAQRGNATAVSRRSPAAESPSSPLTGMPPLSSSLDDTKRFHQYRHHQQLHPQQQQKELQQKEPQQQQQQQQQHLLQQQQQQQKQQQQQQRMQHQQQQQQQEQQQHQQQLQQVLGTQIRAEALLRAHSVSSGHSRLSVFGVRAREHNHSEFLGMEPSRYHPYHSGRNSSFSAPPLSSAAMAVLIERQHQQELHQPEHGRHQPLQIMREGQPQALEHHEQQRRLHLQRQQQLLLLHLRQQRQLQQQQEEEQQQQQHQQQLREQDLLQQVQRHQHQQQRHIQQQGQIEMELQDLVPLPQQASADMLTLLAQSKGGGKSPVDFGGER